MNGQGNDPKMKCLTTSNELQENVRGKKVMRSATSYKT